MERILGRSRRWARRIERRPSMLAPHGRWLEIVTLLVVIAIGVSFRLDDLGRWKEQEARTFVHGEPIPVGLDAFRYLGISQDLVENVHLEVDDKRGVPDFARRRFPPPLLSVLAAGISEATPFSLSWVAAILPVVLGSLLAIPLYLLGRFYAGPFAGFISGLLGVLYPFYVARSNVGRFDTDCMNVTFAVSAAYFFLRFGTDESRTRYLFFLGGLANYLLFLWWWDQAPAVVTATTLLPLGAALSFFYRAPRREASLFCGALALAVILLLWGTGPGAPLEMVETLWSQLELMQEQSPSDFPNVGLSIEEMGQPSFATVVHYTTRNVPAFAFALVGVAWLSWNRPREASFLVGLGVLALTVPFGNRFVIFLVPLLALGSGFLLSALWGLRRRFVPLYALVPVLVTALLWPLQVANERQTRWPTELGPVAAGMLAAAKSTPIDAVIWAWWDHGHALNFWARRATVNDGTLLYGGERTVYNAIPLVADSQRMAANFMHFYVVRGMTGLNELYLAAGGDKALALLLAKQILGAGPEHARRILEEARLEAVGPWQSIDDWLRFFFPEERRPVYLFLDELLTRVSYWWHWFGTWDVETHEGRHAPYIACFDLREAKGRLTGSHGLDLDLQTGDLHLRDKNLRIAQIAIRKKDGSLETRRFAHRTPYRFELSVPLAFGALMNAEIADSVFNQLFLHQRNATEYFRLVQSDAPYYQLWEVTGDSLPRSGN